MINDIIAGALLSGPFIYALVWLGEPAAWLGAVIGVIGSEIVRSSLKPND